MTGFDLIIHGGHVVAEGKPQDVIDSPASLTGQYLSGARAIEILEPRQPQAVDDLELVPLLARAGLDARDANAAGRYLVLELAAAQPSFVVSAGARALADAGKLDAALSDMDMVVELDPKSSIALENRGALKRRKRDDDLPEPLRIGRQPGRHASA